MVIEFDDSELRTQLEETMLEVEQIDEQTKKAKADLAMRNNQDEVELLKARYSVRRAELEVKRNELLSEIDAKKNVLNLEESRRRHVRIISGVVANLPAHDCISGDADGCSSQCSRTSRIARSYNSGGPLWCSSLTPAVQKTDT